MTMIITAVGGRIVLRGGIAPPRQAAAVAAAVVVVVVVALAAVVAAVKAVGPDLEVGSDEKVKDSRYLAQIADVNMRSIFYQA